MTGFTPITRTEKLPYGDMRLASKSVKRKGDFEYRHIEGEAEPVAVKVGSGEVWQDYPNGQDQKYHERMCDERSN